MCMAALMWSCSDEEYSVSSSDLLSFSADTISLDTVFSCVPTPTKSFWVHNKTDRHIALSTVRLERGNQSGFRVNVDGVFLGHNTGYQTNDVEVRSGDSIRVFVELTSLANNNDEPRLLEDNLVFNLNSGAQQKINLRAFSWDAVILKDKEITSDTIFTADKPIVVYGSLNVAENATLTLDPGTTLYFNDQASLDVYGRLLCKGEAGNEVTLRGYRLDHMFDYLPYDRVSGQWQGVKIHESSYGNKMNYTDLHSAFNGIEIDSCSTEKMTLLMTSCTVHNCQGYGILNHCSYVELDNCQITNTLKDCFCTEAGLALLDNCTLAQFYPYDSNRGVALRFSSAKGGVQLGCYNSIVTGYADDELMGEQGDTLSTFYYEFKNCILRTPKVETADSVLFVNVLFENPNDTLPNGKEHFVLIDTDNLIYDFRLDSISPAIDRGDASLAMPTDRLGIRRDEKPDIGAYEYQKQS